MERKVCYTNQSILRRRRTLNDFVWRAIAAVLTGASSVLDKLRRLFVIGIAWMRDLRNKVLTSLKSSPLVFFLVLVFLVIIGQAFYSRDYDRAMFFVAFLAFAASLLQSEMRVVFYPPDIEIEMSEHRGVAVVAYIDPFELDDGTTGFKGVKVWYFHLLVKNHRRFSPARSARVICKQLSIVDKDGRTKYASYSPRIPMKWAHHDVLGNLRNIHTTDLCDLCSIRPPISPHIAPQLDLELAFTNSAISTAIAGGESFKVVLEVEYEGGVIPKQWEVTIKWNGEWSADPEEMLKNVRIEVARIN